MNKRGNYFNLIVFERKRKKNKIIIDYRSQQEYLKSAQWEN